MLRETGKEMKHLWFSFSFNMFLNAWENWGGAAMQCKDNKYPWQWQYSNREGGDTLRPTFIHINMQSTSPVLAWYHMICLKVNILRLCEISLTVCLMFLYWICPQFGSNLILLVHEELTYFPRFGAFENLHGRPSPRRGLRFTPSFNSNV